MKAFVIILPLLGLALLNGCSDRPVAALSHTSCCRTNLPCASNSSLPDRSIYQLDSLWTTDSGAQTNLAALRGRIQVITIFFANCQAACPLLVNDMKRIEAALPPEAREHVGFVLVTFDPDRDTPEALRAYRNRQGLAQNWTLLRGKPEDVQELAVVLGLKYKKDLQGQFAHSNVITILSPEGEIIQQQSGLPQTIEPLVAAIKRAGLSH
jgi:protein SCO1/2